MIGIVVVSHGDLAKALIKTSEFIMGVQSGIVDVSVDAEDRLDGIGKKVENAIKQVDIGNGVLILSDMLGGSPSIASLSFVDSKYKVEVIAGVNLPMLLEVLLNRNKMNLLDLTKLAVEKSKKSIVFASMEKRKSGCKSCNLKK